jgi:hypothetical protein
LTSELTIARQGLTIGATHPQPFLL